MFTSATFWKNTASVLSGTLVAQAIPLVGTLIVARLFAPADFGVFAAWLAIVNVLSVVLTARFESSLAVVPDGAPRDIAFFATIATTLLLSAAAKAIMLTIPLATPSLFGRSEEHTSELQSLMR